ncbi:hypothetical protein S83_067011, partial [Arachis hypogaea]
CVLIFVHRIRLAKGGSMYRRVPSISNESICCRSQASTSTMSNFGILLSAMPYPAVSSQDIVSPSSAEIIRHISSIFYWCVGGCGSCLVYEYLYCWIESISDIEIDKINKPYLPLASGEYSVGTGVTIVASFSFL